MFGSRPGRNANFGLNFVAGFLKPSILPFGDEEALFLGGFDPVRAPPSPSGD